MKKQKIAWSLREESEWLEQFTGEQAAARALRQEIEKTDREIDRVVYELYGLTEVALALSLRAWQIRLISKIRMAHVLLRPGRTTRHSHLAC